MTSRMGGGARMVAVRLALAIASVAGLAGCESDARQDVLLVRPSSDAIVVSGMPMFRDRPIDENLRGSLELTDYRMALQRAGLLDRLREGGPFTVFAAANPAMEAEQNAAGGQLLTPAERPALRRLLSYSIVPGFYTPQRLQHMIAQSRGPVTLPTLDRSARLTVAEDPATGALVLRDPRGGAPSALSWISARQSNGMLYVSPVLPVPPEAQFASAGPLPDGSGASGLDNSRFYVPGDFNTGVGATSLRR